MPGCCGCFITTLARSSTPLTVCTQAVVPAAALVWTPDSLHFYDSSVEGGLVHARSCPIAVPLQSCVPLPSSRYFTLDIHGTCSVWEVAGSGVPHLLQSCALAPADSSSHAWLPTGVVTSGVQDGRLCVCCFTNTVHVIHTTSHEGLRVLTASAVPCFGPLSAPSADVAEAALLTLQSTWQPYALTWLPQQLQTDVLGRQLVAVLHKYTPSGGIPSVHVDTLVVDWGAAALQPGPWSCRLVHPTSRLLVQVEGHPTLPPGLLLINSTGVLLLGDPGPGINSTLGPDATTSSSSGGGGSHSVGPAHLVDWQLQGVPTCCCRVGERWQWVVGDDMAGLVLLDLSAATPTFMTLATTSPPSVPSLLVHLPLAVPAAAADSGSNGSDGVLFLGSSTGSSQVLRVPPAAGLPPTNTAASAQSGPAPQVWPILQSAVLPSVAASTCGVPFTDPSGAWPEQQLLLGAGLAPRGRVLKLRGGVGLHPYILDGPELPGSVALFAVAASAAAAGGSCSGVQHHHQQQQQQQQQQPEDELLVVSLESSERTLVLSLSGSTFSQLDLPHLDTGAASLLVAGLPPSAGGGLVQVAAAGGIRRLGPGPNWELVDTWVSPGPLSLAAAHQGSLVVVSGQTLYSFDLTVASGLQQPQGQCQLLQQASSLDLLQVPCSHPGAPAAPGSGLPGGDPLSDAQAAAQHSAGAHQLLVAAGLWVENRVVLLSWPHLEEVGEVDLEGQQPRSSSLLMVAGRPVLVVGTATGQVLLWELVPHREPPTNTSSGSRVQWRWSVRHGRCVMVTHSSISLQRLRLPLNGTSGTATTSSSSSSGSKGLQEALVECVWAQGAAGALLSPDPQAHLLLTTLSTCLDKPHRSSSSSSTPAVTDLVRVSRVCGSDGVVSLVGVHTTTMPHSLAYVAANTRLCFGGVDPEHRLRWVAAPVRDTVEALVVHEPTGCVVALTAASDGAQHLRVLEATSLRQLLSLRLAAGHYYSTLACVDLPCAASPGGPQPATAARAAGGQFEPAAAASSSRAGADTAGGGSVGSGAAAAGACLVTRPFLVLGSYLLLPQHTQLPAPLGTDPPHNKHPRQGMLTFFDLAKVSQLEGAGGSSGSSMGSRTHVHYELRHLSTIALEPGCLPSCLAVARPHWVSPRSDEESGPGSGRKKMAGGKVPSAAAHTSAAAAAERDAALTARTAAAQSTAQQHAAAVEEEALSRGWLGWTTRLLGGTAAQLPLLLVGGERGVQAYHVWIDDQQHTVQQQAQQLVAAATGLQQVATHAEWTSHGLACTVQRVTPGDASTSPARAAGTPAAAPPPCRIILQPVAGWSPPAGGCVIQLLVTGRCVVALEALGGASLAVLVCSPGGVQLVPVAQGPQHFTTAVAAFSRQQAACVAQQLATSPAQDTPGGDAGTSLLGPAEQGDAVADPAADPLPDDLQCLLVAGHPQGLQLLQVEPDDLGEALKAAREAAAAAAAQGRAVKWWDVLGAPLQEMPNPSVLAPYLDQEGFLEDRNAQLLQMAQGGVDQMVRQLQAFHMDLDGQQMEVDEQPSAAAGGGGSRAAGATGSSSSAAVVLPWGLPGDPPGLLQNSLMEWAWTLEVVRQRSSSSSTDDSSSSSSSSRREWWRQLLQQMQAGLPYAVPLEPHRPRMHSVAAAQPPGVCTLALPARLGLHVSPWGQQQQGARQPQQQQQGHMSLGASSAAGPAVPPQASGGSGRWQGSVVCLTPAGGMLGVQLLPPSASEALGDAPQGLQRCLRAWAQDQQRTAAAAAGGDHSSDQGPAAMDTDTPASVGGAPPELGGAMSSGRGWRRDKAAAVAGCWGWQTPAAAARRRTEQAAAAQAGGGGDLVHTASGATSLPDDPRLAMGRCVDADLLQLLAPQLLEQDGLRSGVSVAAAGVHVGSEQLQPALCLWSLLKGALN